MGSTKTVAPLEEVDNVLAARRNGDRMRRCNTIDMPRDVRRVLGDINDVLEDVENDLLDDIRTIIGKFDYKAIVFDPYPLLLAISDGVSGENDDFNKLLFSSTISNNLIDKIKNLFKQAFKDTFEQIMSDSAGTEIVLTFVVSGVVDAYRAWYLSDRVIGLKQVAHELAEVISKGLGDVIKEA